MVVAPTRILSPSLSTMDSMRSPLTKVPFRLPMSSATRAPSALAESARAGARCPPRDHQIGADRAADDQPVTDLGHGADAVAVEDDEICLFRLVLTCDQIFGEASRRLGRLIPFVVTHGTASMLADPSRNETFCQRNRSAPPAASQARISGTRPVALS